MPHHHFAFHLGVGMGKRHRVSLALKLEVVSVGASSDHLLGRKIDRAENPDRGIQHAGVAGWTFS